MTVQSRTMINFRYNQYLYKLDQEPWQQCCDTTKGSFLSLIYCTCTTEETQSRISDSTDQSEPSIRRIIYRVTFIEEGWRQKQRQRSSHQFGGHTTFAFASLSILLLWLLSKPRIIQPPQLKDKYRRKGKRRRCCLRDRIYSIPCCASLAFLHQGELKNRTNCTRMI